MVKLRRERKRELKAERAPKAIPLFSVKVR